MHRRSTSTLALAAFVAVMTLWVPASLSGAQQQPTFRAGQIIVPVFVTVFDADQRLVTDLTKEDFEVLDNGKPQTLSVFENESLPINVVTMFDTSLSMAGSISLLKAAAEQFFIRLFPKDRAKVGSFNDKIIVDHEFLSDRDLLIAQVRHMDFGNNTLLWDAMAVAIDELKGVNDRKVILIFTDGEDFGSKLGEGTIVERAQADEIMVYAVGLANEFNINGKVTVTKPDGGLKKIAEETGGGYFELRKTSALGPAFTRIVQELHSQYALGFAAPALDNKVHKLTVKLSKPGLTSRARKNYVASRQATPSDAGAAGSVKK